VVGALTLRQQDREERRHGFRRLLSDGIESR
jgi:hypothetical protein